MSARAWLVLDLVAFAGACVAVVQGYSSGNPRLLVIASALAVISGVCSIVHGRIKQGES